jgi:hypothetical protein
MNQGIVQIHSLKMKDILSSRTYLKAVDSRTMIANKFPNPKIVPWTDQPNTSELAEVDV